MQNKNFSLINCTFLNCLFYWLLGSNYLLATLQSPTLYLNAKQAYDHTGTQLGIAFFNLIGYLTYLSMPCVCICLTSYLLSKLIKQTFIIHTISFIGFFAFSLFIFIDAKIFYLFHFHLNKPLLILFFNEELSQILSLSFYESLILILSVIGLITIQVLIFSLNYPLKKLKLGKWLFFLWLITSTIYSQMLTITAGRNNNIFSQHLSNLPHALNLYKLIANKNSAEFLNKFNANIENNLNTSRFNYPKKKLTFKTTANKKPNIILIGIDTLRSDIVNQNYMPNIDNFSKESLQFNNHYSGGNSTQAGLFSLFYALPSNYWHAALKTKTPPVFMKTLKNMGYNRKVIWSTNMHHPKVSQTLYLNIDNLRLNSAPGNDPILWDKHSTQQSIQFLKQQKKHTPFFLHVFYHSLHAFCRTDSFKEHFKPSLKQCGRFSINEKTDPIPFKNRYLNVAKTLDKIIQPLLKEIKESGLLKNTIVIITSDHGQEFNDNKQNYWGHASNYTKEQIKVPLVIYWPGKKHRTIAYTTTHFDVMPTLLKYALQCNNDFSDHSIGYDLFINTSNRTLIAGSYVDMALVKKNRITVFKTTGEIELFNHKQQPLHQAPSIKDLHKFLELTQANII